MAAGVDAQKQRVIGPATLEFAAPRVSGARHALCGTAVLRRPHVGFRQRAITGVIAGIESVLRAADDHNGNIPGTSIVPVHPRRRRDAAQDITAEATKGVGHDGPRAHPN